MRFDCADIVTWARAYTGPKFHGVLCDPPYELGFMGKSWNSSGVAFQPDTWAAIGACLVPGAHLLAFGGTRTFHRLVCAIEDAGFEIRDTVNYLHGEPAIDHPLLWITGQGFPKSHNLDGAYTGYGTALKPAVELIAVARWSLAGTVAANCMEHGAGALWIDGCRVPTNGEAWPGNEANAHSDYSGKVYGEFGRQYAKPSHAGGRWPSNLIHDGSAEVLAGFPQTGPSTGGGGRREAGADTRNGIYGKYGARNLPPNVGLGDTGSAARFFQACKFDDIELLFCRAKAIIDVWNLDFASVAGSDLSPKNQRAASVLSNAVTEASLGATQLSGFSGLSTSATPRELRALLETLITAILILENGRLPDRPEDAQTPNGCRVRFAATPKQTGTTTITISLPKSDGYADPVMFAVTPFSMAHGVADSASRICYTAKASRRERDAGLEGFEAQRGRQCYDPQYHEGGGKLPPRPGNPHPTVKPLSLCEYLARLILPPPCVQPRRILVPFAGSGSEAIGAMRAGWDEVVGVEMNQEYVDIAKARAAYWAGEMMEKAA